MQRLLCGTLVLVGGARPALWCSLLLFAVGVAGAPLERPTLRLGPKPADAAPERRASSQPTAPDGAREVPFVETAPGPALTEPEKERGYLLFQRPSTECVYPNTRPLADERIDSLVAFATPGEFEPVTFALYPVRPLQNGKVRVSPLTSSAGEIPAGSIEVRLATYWNVGYPAYTTLTTYRRVPELLERVTVHSSPAGECQWYWLTIHVPGDAKPGLYRGTVRVWDDGFGQAVEVPLALRVLGFRLQKDPHKHFSAYFYVRNRALYKGRDEAFIRHAADKDYQAMVNFGLDMLPTLYLNCPDGKRIVLAESGELERMLAAGLKGPAPVTADGVIGRIYRDTTPGGKRENHWRISPLPPPAFYERVTDLFRAFEAERKAKGWPEFICCPIDEVDVSCKEFGAKVYAAVKAAGLRTYATKDPIGADAADYAPYLDIWCSQPYSVPYERIVSQDRFEYWCYPNHNAGEIKDRQTMCKGGRMTYGFGLWRSGYTTLIPWHWCWPSEPDPFDYLRGRFSGCGQRVDDDGEVIPAVYWACFREGYDDARYLYTLQQAIVERESSKDAACLAAVAEGRRLLQETWDAIHVQPKYLAEGLWPSEEFDAVRWRLAAQTARLLEYPAAAEAIAPSVLLTEPARPQPAAETPSPYEAAARATRLETLDLGGSFADWKNGTAEGKTEITEAARHANQIGLRWTVDIDHLHDGGEGGNYPVGWPRVARDFKPDELDLSRFDTLELWLRIDSSREEAAIDHTRVGLVISSHARKKALYEKTVDLGSRQRVWIPLRFPVKPMLVAADAGAEPWKSISRIQLYVSEQDYRHGTRLIFDVGEVSLLRLTAPALAGVDAPNHLLLPRSTLAFSFDVIGTAAVAKGSHTVVASCEEAAGTVCAQTRQDLADPHRAVLPLTATRPGAYRLRLTITDATGQQCSEWAQPITLHAGPLYDTTRFEDAPKPPSELVEWFTPPEKYRADFGGFRSPLLFADGTPVRTAADWQRRRAEILATWHQLMGPWPPLIERPRVEVMHTSRRENITQQELRIEIALRGEMVEGLLLIPEGEGAEGSHPARKRPAVLVVYYNAETGVGLGAPLRDYAWQLARRGFVALSIGKPNAHIDLTTTDKPRTEPYLGPVGRPVRLQPLSALAYAAANAHTVLAQRPEVDPARIAIVGHSFGGKWAMFASCLYDKFACAVWSDPGIVFDERDRRRQNPNGSVNYWDVWYLGFEPGAIAEPKNAGAWRKLPSEGQARTGAYKALVEGGHDLVELHALMAPRPFLVSGGTADLPERWPALNHVMAVNKLLGCEHRVALTQREGHTPTEQANEQVYRFFQWWLQPRQAAP